MTRTEFISRIERYYGEYRPEIKKMIAVYLAGQKVPDEVLPAVYTETVKQHTGQYNRPPDLAMIRPILYEEVDRYYENRRLEAPALPAPPDDADPELAREFMSAVMGAMRGGRNPANDPTVRGILERLGVSEMVERVEEPNREENDGE